MLLTIDAHQDIGALGGELPGTSAGADAGDAAVIIEGDGVAVAGFALTRWFGPGLTSVRFALLAMGLLLLFRRIGL